jgi:hypothetical protein
MPYTRHKLETACQQVGKYTEEHMTSIPLTQLVRDTCVWGYVYKHDDDKNVCLVQEAYNDFKHTGKLKFVDMDNELIMDMETMISYFAKYEKSDYLSFSLVDVRTSNRPDVHAVFLLEYLMPITSVLEPPTLLSQGSNGEILINVTPSDLLNKITEDDIISLVRSGVSYNVENDAFYLYVD